MPTGGRLTLSWVGKDQALLPTATGGYEWVNRDDPRVTEVRLLHHVSSVGELKQSPPEDNLLIAGDSFHAIQALTHIPEYAKEYRGKIAQIYIDPPFNTGQAFATYDDALEHSVWLTMMRDRLKVLHDLLLPTGTIWVHLDSTEVHRCRLLMDDEFGPSNYLATVIWQRTTAKSLARRTMGTMHEQILVYGASEAAELKRLLIPLDATYQASRFTRTDDRGTYDTGDLTAGSYRPHLDSGQPWKGFNPSDKRRCWAVPSNILREIGLDPTEMSRLTMREKLDTLDEAGYIAWPDKLDGFPRYKKYLHRAKGRAIGDLWTDINVINSQAAERTGFPTQKPEALLQRILDMGSNPGDIVLDCFAGSGTTAAVAHKMKRRWITIESEQATVDSYLQDRLKGVVNGEDTGGVTETVNWKKGGGFRTLSIGPSMYEVSNGRAFLADWTANGQFAHAVCAQLGFSVVAEPPFAGRKGKMLLAVVDGVADAETVRAVTSRLDDSERVMLVAKAIGPEAEATLRQLSPGSRLRKAPRDLFRRGVRR